MGHRWRSAALNVHSSLNMYKYVCTTIVIKATWKRNPPTHTRARNKENEFCHTHVHTHLSILSTVYTVHSSEHTQYFKHTKKTRTNRRKHGEVTGTRIPTSASVTSLHTIQQHSSSPPAFQCQAYISTTRVNTLTIPVQA